MKQDMGEENDVWGDTFRIADLKDVEPIAKAYEALRKMDRRLPAIPDAQGTEPKGYLDKVIGALNTGFTEIAAELTKHTAGTPAVMEDIITLGGHLTNMAVEFVTQGGACESKIQRLREFATQCEPENLARHFPDTVTFCLHELPERLQDLPLTTIDIVAPVLVKFTPVNFRIRQAIETLPEDSPARARLVEVLGREFDACGADQTEKKRRIGGEMILAILGMPRKVTAPLAAKFDSHLADMLLDQDQRVREEAATQGGWLNRRGSSSRELPRLWRASLSIIDGLATSPERFSWARKNDFLVPFSIMLRGFPAELDATVANKLLPLANALRVGTQARAELIRTLANAKHPVPEVDALISSLLNATDRYAAYNHRSGCLAIGDRGQIADEQLARVLTLAESGLRLDGDKWGPIVWALSAVGPSQKRAKEAVKILVDLAPNLRTPARWRECVDSLVSLAIRGVPTAAESFAEYLEKVRRGGHDQRRKVINYLNFKLELFRRDEAKRSS